MLIYDFAASAHAASDLPQRSELHAALAAAEYKTSVTPSGLAAPNRAQRLRFEFGEQGIRILDRIEGETLVAVRTSRIGRAAGGTELPRGDLRHEGTRVELVRPGVVEWFVNGPAGLEHGYEIAERPDGSGPLHIQLQVAGASARTDQAGARLSTPRRELRYGKLFARDAAQRDLDTRMVVVDARRIDLVIEDERAVYPISIDPIYEDAGIQSDQIDASLGISVDGAGDVNGDGYADVIMGAPSYDSGQADEGAAFIFYGGPSGIAGASVASAGTRLDGDQAGASFGQSVAGAGDVNGDGYDDVIVGAYYYDAGQTDEGAAFVFHGNRNGIANLGAASASVRLEGDQADAGFGFSVDGDFNYNGDAYSDVVVGAPAFPNTEGRGAVFVYPGSRSGISPTGEISVHGTGGLGWSVAAGDVNALGKDDVVAGMPVFDDPKGAVLVWIFDPPPFIQSDTLLDLNEGEGGRFGWSVSRGGELDSEQGDEIWVGAPFFDAPGANDAGALYVIDSSTGYIQGNWAGSRFRVRTGAIADELFAYSVDGGFNFDGQNLDDLIVGALGGNGSYRVYGGSTCTPSLCPGGVGLTSLGTGSGAQEGQGVGWSVAGAGDVNGDGIDEVIVGEPGFSHGEVNEGAVEVLTSVEAPEVSAVVSGLTAVTVLGLSRMRRRFRSP